MKSIYPSNYQVGSQDHKYSDANPSSLQTRTGYAAASAYPTRYGHDGIICLFTACSHTPSISLSMCPLFLRSPLYHGIIRHLFNSGTYSRVEQGAAPLVFPFPTQPVNSWRFQGTVWALSVRFPRHIPSSNPDHCVSVSQPMGILRFSTILSVKHCTFVEHL